MNISSDTIWHYSLYSSKPAYQIGFHRKPRVILSASDSSGTYYTDDEDTYYDSDDDESYYTSSSEVRKMLSSQSKITTLCSRGVKSCILFAYVVLTIQNHCVMYQKSEMNLWASPCNGNCPHDSSQLKAIDSLFENVLSKYFVLVLYTHRE